MHLVPLFIFWSHVVCIGLLCDGGGKSVNRPSRKLSGKIDKNLLFKNVLII